MLILDGWTGGAEISDCGTYRYSLSREWSDGEGTVLWIMLNPSTADSCLNDPTIRRCIGFSRAWGAKRLEVRNLFAYRATDPKAMIAAHASGVDVVGNTSDVLFPNDRRILEAAERASRIICAWGAEPFAKHRAKFIMRMLGHLKLECLGLTKNKDPKHPLYVKADAELIVCNGSTSFEPERLDRIRNGGNEWAKYAAILGRKP